eukprot:jgi/Psemu1/313773/fgenesh1_kg.1302_\
MAAGAGATVLFSVDSSAEQPVPLVAAVAAAAAADHAHCHFYLLQQQQKDPSSTNGWGGEWLLIQFFIRNRALQLHNPAPPPAPPPLLR